MCEYRTKHFPCCNLLILYLLSFSPSTRFSRFIRQNECRDMFLFLCRFFKNLQWLPRHQSTLQLRLSCFSCLAVLKWFALIFQILNCSVKLFVVENAYGIFGFLHNSSCLFFLCEVFAISKHLVGVLLKSFCSAVPKGINLFELSATVCG